MRAPIVESGATHKARGNATARERSALTTKPDHRPDGWTEDDSSNFIDYGRYFVPERELQIATICDLVPRAHGRFRIVELCSGAGLLARALLERFADARLHAYDGSPVMLEATRKVVGAHAGRLTTVAFDLAATDWRSLDGPVWAVVSSLAIHHLDGPAKRALFADLAAAIEPGGALIIADLVRPATKLGADLAARTWDDTVRRRALELDGGLDAFRHFERTGWNYFADPDPDPIDQPSPLADQLTWLREAGFEAVDVHWMKAGHAIFGGRKPAG